MTARAKVAKNRVAELEAALEAKTREVKVLEGRVAGYQEALLTKAKKEAREKFHECKECGAVWLDDKVPTHRFRCPEWIPYFNRLERKSGYIIGAKLAPKRGLLRPRSPGISCAVHHTDAEGRSIPCPGYPHANVGGHP